MHANSTQVWLSTSACFVLFALFLETHFWMPVVQVEWHGVVWTCPAEEEGIQYALYFQVPNIKFFIPFFSNCSLKYFFKVAFSWEQSNVRNIECIIHTVCFILCCIVLILNGLLEIFECGTKMVLKPGCPDSIMRSLCPSPQVRSLMEAEWRMPGTNAASGQSSKASSLRKPWSLATPSPPQVFSFSSCVCLWVYAKGHLSQCILIYSYIFFGYVVFSPVCLRYLLCARDRWARAI